MEWLLDLGHHFMGAIFFVVVLGAYMLGPILALFGLYFLFKVFRKANRWVDKE